MESWKALNKVQCITVHQTIGDYLRHVIESGHQVRKFGMSYFFNSILSKGIWQLGALPPQTPTERLFLIDSIALDAHLLSILHDRDMYKDLRARRDQDTQSILNILQEVTHHFAHCLASYRLTTNNSVWTLLLILPLNIVIPAHSSSCLVIPVSILNV